jgi:hypothetical protein
MPGTARRIAVAALAVTILCAALAAPAGAKRYAGTIDEERFQAPRPSTEFVLKVKGKRARFTQLGLALECTPDDRNDPRLLLDVSTPWRRMKTVVGSRSYTFIGSVSTPSGRATVEVVLGLTPFAGALSAKLGGCTDAYVDFKRS